MHKLTVDSIRTALFHRGSFKLTPSPFYVDGQPDWSDPKNLTVAPEKEVSDGWIWSPDWQKVEEEEKEVENGLVIRGRLWGGCLNSLYKILAASTTEMLIPPANELDGCILFIETSESMPSSS